MAYFEKHVFICNNERPADSPRGDCTRKGGKEVREKFKDELAKRGLKGTMRANMAGCLDACETGCSVVVYPDNVILSGVTAKDVPALLAYLRGEGDPPGEITSFDTPAERHRRAFYRQAQRCGAFCPLAQFEEIAIESGFDPSWVDEQARRGFIARKPSPDSAEPSMVITKKAADRYRLEADNEEAG